MKHSSQTIPQTARLNPAPESVRAIKLIRETIKSLDLDLSGYTVLTEVGSNSFLYSPVIAALAKAKKVFAWTRDSVYGKGDEIVAACNNVLCTLEVADKVEFSIGSKPAHHISEAHIITNSGFTRPLNESLLKHANSSVVIPLMFEAWELRDGDVDVEYCRNRKIKVAGTNENHPLIKVFDYVQVLSLKLLMNAGLEVMGNRIIVWSDDHFGSNAVLAFKNAGAADVFMTNDLDSFYSKISEADAVFICDYSEHSTIIGENGIFDLEEISRRNPSVVFVHLYGDVQPDFASKSNFLIYPAKKGSPQVMTETLSYAGMVPTLRLQAAGLKVAEEMLKNRITELSQPITF